MEPLVFIPPHEVIIPDSINWWPPSLTLVALIIAVIAMIIWIVIVICRYRRAFAAKRQAIIELQVLLAQHQDNNDTNLQLTLINQMLKRVALHYYPQEKALITILHGQDWSAWLCSKIKRKPAANYAASLVLLNQSIYRASEQLPSMITVPAAVDIAQTWCHKGLPRFNFVTMRLTAPHPVMPIGALEHG